MTFQPHDRNCSAALDLLAKGDLVAWAGHTAACPDCQAPATRRERLRRLARAVVHGGADAIPCAECQARLPRYVKARLDGVEMEPQVAQHLGDCPACAAIGADLQATLALERAGRLAEPATWPSFDLSFLPPAAKRAPQCDPWHARLGSRIQTRLDEAGRLIAAEIQIFTQPMLPRPAVAVWEGGVEQKSERTLAAEVADVGGMNLGIEVTMTRSDEETEVGQVRVVVDSPRLTQGPAGMRVTVRCREWSQTQAADDLGVALFQAAPVAGLADMRIEIVLPGQVV